MVRDDDFCDHATAFGLTQRRALFRTVELLQSFTRVAQAKAFGGQLADEAGPVVAHAQYQAVARALGANLDAARAVDLADTMLDRVLRQRLQNEIGYQRIGDLLARLDVDLEPSAEADFHDFKITLQKRQLLLERDLGLVGAFEGVAQQFTQAGDHPSHSTWIALYQCRDGM